MSRESAEQSPARPGREAESAQALTARVAHDLRSPLAAITGFAEALRAADGARLSERGLHYLGRIEAAAQRMQGLVEGLGQLANLSQHVLQRREFDLGNLCQQVLAQLRADSPRPEVEVHIASGLVVRADPQLLRLALQQLLANAWKFTSRQPAARIAFDCAVDAEGRRWFQLRDDGAGFDMAWAHKLFLPFERLHPPSEFPGNGIGLAIVRRIVEAHGGAVRADSRPGCTTFAFRLD